ncbi:LacI family DNA-binding transcriptional regulator [Orenia marismortui]|uniref:LacI family transcriptional regulator n=1 Tax=Orenia marismortui TaxID=46469 RepID=A0A4R8GT88_9FIRM|nr:LacI family DNA-binding transcriptional regulator [Orenia marismortui]TDX49222.1 LacI family transcriptional regulator [Orenia marismortui]
MAITIKEIAKLSGVSKSTVSRVINNAESVSDKARSKVQKVIEETGYIPNSIAKDLKKNSTDSIGIIIPRINTNTISSAVEGISNIMYDNGYSLLLTNTRLDIKEEIKYLELLKEKRVSGILFFATEVTQKHIETLNKINLPIVVLGQDISDMVNFPSVIHDDFNSAKDIVEYLVGYGHQRIAYIGVQEKDVAVGQLRKKGYVEALKNNDLELKQEYIYTKSDFSISSGYEGMKKIVKNSKELPTAVFAVTDSLAIGAIKYLKDSGYKVPEDISVVGIGNSDISSWMTPELTTVDYDHLKSGEEASELLLKYISGDEFEDKLIMDYHIVERNSVKKI